MTQHMQESQPKTQSRKNDDRTLMPWSHRLPAWARLLIDLIVGVAVGMIGTMAHRMGASANIPYGLVLAYVLTAIATWSARSRDGATGLALHLIGSSLMVWTVMAGYGPGGDAMIPVGFGDSASLPYFSNNVGYFWLYGVVLIPLVMLALPKRWFTMPPREADDAPENVSDESQETDNAADQPVD
ncbi:hypothetical protein [Bifidobacterium sp.]|uniref:hypothetical protein n=1 Tax=Bifidobacterium sp. TaxID=41200 RepID=UPI003D7CFD23